MPTVAENSKRLDGHDIEIRELQNKFDSFQVENARQLTKLETKLDYQDKTLLGMRDDLKILISKPSENMSRFSWLVISCVVGLVLGYIWTNLIK